ncbi:MAG TPA: TPM domain-containing protein, partial [Rhodoglobus sp.]|nr:TPM domain-containing protein [Rhodoglobus sp.]
MLFRGGAAVVALAAGMLLLSSTPALADDPVDLGGAYIVDEVGALQGRESDVQLAIDSLYDRAGLQFFVVFVDTFDDPADPADWADATADENFLGTNDLLLAVALDDRLYGLSVGPDLPLSDPQLDRVEAAIESQLRAGDWAQAAIDGAQTLQAEATGVVGPNQPDRSDERAGAVPGWVLPTVGGAAVLGVGAVIGTVLMRRRRRDQDAAPVERLDLQQLDRRAGSLLVRLDDAVKTSEQELGFAQAQFGDEATAPFVAALDGAKRKVSEAFALRAQLDDADPQTAPDRRAATARIVELCEAADAELDAQADAFEQLRDLERTAPQAIEALVPRIGELRARLPQEEQRLADLHRRFAPGAMAPVDGNVTEAAARLAAAEHELDEARGQVRSGATG